MKLIKSFNVRLAQADDRLDEILGKARMHRGAIKQADAAEMEEGKNIQTQHHPSRKSHYQQSAQQAPSASPRHQPTSQLKNSHRRLSGRFPGFRSLTLFLCQQVKAGSSAYSRLPAMADWLVLIYETSISTNFCFSFGIYHFFNFIPYTRSHCDPSLVDAFLSPRAQTNTPLEA